VKSLSPDTLADRLAVNDVLIAYATAVDGRDWDLLASCFLPDADIVYEPVGRFDGCAALAAAMRASLEGVTTQHIITNVAVELDGNRASTRCYGHAQHGRDGEYFTTGATYVDDLVKVDDAWRIVSRHVETTWAIGNPGVVGLARFGSDQDERI
jgi:3-phenylpropionate/cinnamic acid dioxygenase small subunit